MNRSMGIPVAAVISAGTVLARALARHRRASAARTAAPRTIATDPARWRAVTVQRRVDEVRGAGLAPLAVLGPAVEVAVRSAPDGKGTVVAARWRGVPADHPDAARAVGDLRAALRQAKQELEIGWQVTPPHLQARLPARPAPSTPPPRGVELGGIDLGGVDLGGVDLGGVDLDLGGVDLGGVEEHARGGGAR